MATNNQDKAYSKILQGIFSEHPETFRDLVADIVNQLLRAEQSEYLRAAPYERSDERIDYRSGFKPRYLRTRIGKLTLMVPQTRDGFTTSALERYQRSERALLSGIGEMALKGVSTRKVKDVTEAFFGFPVSAQMVSGLNKRLEEELKVWRQRKLGEAYPYLIVDARYEKMRVEGKVVSQAVLIIAGVDASGCRRVLDLMIADSESELSWRELFDRLKDRGLKGVRLVVSDDHKGIIQAVKRCFQGASWQSCQVHFMRNARKSVSAKERTKLMEGLKEIFASKDFNEANERVGELVREISKRRPKLAGKIETKIVDCLAVFGFPASHRKRLSSTNMVERLNKEIKRRTRVIEIFPSMESAERLIGALIIDEDEGWLTGQRYLDMDELYQWEEAQRNKLTGEFEFAEAS